MERPVNALCFAMFLVVSWFTDPVAASVAAEAADRDG
jgi:hypothetical protein